MAERLRDLDIERVSGTLAPITAAERRIAEEEAACEERQAGLEEELARVPADDGATSGEVAAALTTLGGLGGLAGAAGEAAADLRATADDAARKRAEAEGLAEGAEAARQEGGRARREAPSPPRGGRGGAAAPRRRRAAARPVRRALGRTRRGPERGLRCAAGRSGRRRAAEV